MNEKWFGARITGPVAGTFSAEMQRARKAVHAQIEVIARTSSYIGSGSRVRARS